MLNNLRAFPRTCRTLASITVAPLLGMSVWVAIDAYNTLLAQAPEPVPVFQLPSALPAGTTMRVDGSNSMTVINEALKQRFEEKFPGTTVNLAANGTVDALKALVDGKVDLAAIGRALTDAEKAQGLKQVLMDREKIAIVVDADNPFKGSLTAEQFAQMFRGEITNWSQVGGPNTPIRFVDRPESSDTRQALRQYPVFKAAPFVAGSNVTQVAQDDTAMVVQELGQDGISYAIANQVLNQSNVTVLPMHQTLPSDPRYPYSQPLGYVYKGDANSGVQAFLGFATSAPGQEVLATAKEPGAAPVQPAGTTTLPNGSTTAPSPTPEAAPETAPETMASIAPEAMAEATSPNLSFLWWLLPLLGLPLLWWLMKGRGAAVPPVAAAAATREGRMILTPRDCRHAYAYWEVPEAELAEAGRQGRRDLKVRLYDVTNIRDMDQQTPHSMKEFNCREGDSDLHLPIAVDDRDYVAELGYLDADNHWTRITRSESVRVPACEPASNGNQLKTAATIAGGAAAVTGAAMAARSLATGSRVTEAVGTAIAGGTAAVAGIASTVKSSLDRHPDTEKSGSMEQPHDCRIILVPRNFKDAYAYWEVSESYKQVLRNQGGRHLILRVHDATNLDIDDEPPHSTQTYVCSETDQDKHIVIPVSDRDYIAELGYFTDDNRWLRLIRSFHVRVPANN
jgi:phosphate transport system substrate-binding protein